MDAGMKNFNIVYKQDEGTGWWTATYEGRTPIVVQERTIKKAHRKMRLGLSAFFDLDESQFSMTGHTDWSSRDDLTDEDVGLLKSEADLRVEALDVEMKLEATTRVAVKHFTRKRRFSLRKAGTLLGVTHERVAQIAREVQKEEEARI